MRQPTVSEARPLNLIWLPPLHKRRLGPFCVCSEEDGADQQRAERHASHCSRRESRSLRSQPWGQGSAATCVGALAHLLPPPPSMLLSGVFSMSRSEPAINSAEHASTDHCISRSLHHAYDSPPSLATLSPTLAPTPTPHLPSLALVALLHVHVLIGVIANVACQRQRAVGPSEARTMTAFACTIEGCLVSIAHGWSEERREREEEGEDG